MTTIYSTNAAQGGTLGDETLASPNRVFRLAKNGGVPLVAGEVVMAQQQDETQSNLTVAAAAAAGAKTITVNVGSVIDADEYRDGVIYINDQAGAGVVYDIRTHPGSIPAEGDSTGLDQTTALAIQLKDQVAVALTTSSQATLVRNIYKNVVPTWGNPADIVVGVAPIAVAANQHFFCQVRGPAAVKQEGGLFTGRGVMSSQFKRGSVAVAKQVVPSARETFAQPVKETAGTSDLTDANAVAITHGLGVTPLIQNISIFMNEDPTNSITAFYVDNVGATTFDVTANDPGASGLLFGWRAKSHVKDTYGGGTSEPAQYQQDGIEQRFDYDTLRNAPDEALTTVSGVPTIPNRILGYCISPRVSEEFALIFLTISSEFLWQ